MECKFFEEQLCLFTNSSPFRSTIHDDPILTEQLKNEYDTIWECFRNHIAYFKDCRYNGFVYRVLDCHKKDVYYDSHITHWSYDIHSFVSKAKGFETTKRYTWIVAKIQDGFNVNNYQTHNVHCEFECEVIYPMIEDVVVDIYYGTYKEFCEHLKRTKIGKNNEM